VLPATAADNGWVVWPTKTFQASSLRVEDVVGNVHVNVQDGPMRVDVSGSRQMISGVTLKTDGGVLHIQGGEFDNVNVWDWKKWFDFSNIQDQRNGKLFIKVTVPRGTEVRIEDTIGDTTIGDTFGKVHLETTAGNASVGRTSEAHIEMNGSGKASIGDVQGDLHLEIAGSGHLVGHNAGHVHAEIAGSGDAVMDSIATGVGIDITGAGDFTAQRVNGPVKVDIAGSGNVKIADGLANPLHVDILGAGDFRFGGLAVDPRISAMGSGNVKIKAYKGTFKNDGMADVQIGDQNFPGASHPPMPPMPPMPPLPHGAHAPAPPAPPAHHSDDDDDDDN
jgi:hypothetical protein